MRLIEHPEPEVDKIEQLLADRAREHFARHLPPVLQSRGSLRPLDCFEELYGTMLGQARERHLRDAFKLLHAHGSVSDPSKGQNWMDRTITWTG